MAAETAATNAAVATTAGQIVTYAGKPAITYFFAQLRRRRPRDVQNSFLGSAPEPWLVGVADPYDSGPGPQLEAQHQLSTVAAT